MEKEKVIETFEIELFGLPIFISNQITSDGYAPYCNVSLKRLQLVVLDHHWKVGEALPQLDWLQSQSHLVECYQEEFEDKFKDYCLRPLELFEELYEDNDVNFLQFMADPCCFDSEKIEDCVTDFIQAYNQFYHTRIKELSTEVIKSQTQRWQRTFQPNPELTDLIGKSYLTSTLIMLHYSVSS